MDQEVKGRSASNDSDGSRKGSSERGGSRRRRRQRVLGAIDQPRRIPEFPRPPDNTLVFSHVHAHHRSRTTSVADKEERSAGAVAGAAATDDDIISNPSEEGLILARRAEFLGVSTESYYPDAVSALGSTVNLAQGLGFGLGVQHQQHHHHSQYYQHLNQHEHAPVVVLPHSRVPSISQFSVHDPALANSRKGSELGGSASGSGYESSSVIPLGGGGKKEVLNPFAKPFVFGAQIGSSVSVSRTGAEVGTMGTWQPFKGEATPPMPLPALSSSLSSHSCVPSFTQTQTQTHAQTHIRGPGHARIPSFGKPLSAHAREFKPGQFTFRLAGVPQMPRALSPDPPVAATAAAMPGVSPALPSLPLHDDNGNVPKLVFGLPAETSSPFRVQGREKRQRRDSGERIEEGNSMAAFKFPPVGPLGSKRSKEEGEGESKSARASASRQRHRSASLDLQIEQGVKERVNPSVQPLKFAGFSAVEGKMPWVAKEGDGEEEGYKQGVGVDEDVVEPRLKRRKGEDAGVGVDVDEDTNEGQERQIPPPSASKMKRAPIPLDFKHPHPSGTAPAGIFKALAGNNSGDDRTRRGVRSRLGSREIFEHMHNRPSMDDTNVALIAKKASRGLLVRENEERMRRREGGEDADEDEDVFTSVRPHVRRRSSLPDALVDRVSVSLSTSEMSSVGPQDLTSRMELHRIENVIGQLLDEKLGPIRAELKRENTAIKSVSSSGMEEMMSELISLFRAQLRDSATKSLEDSQMEARGELDMQMIKDVTEQSYRELLMAFQKEHGSNGYHYYQQQQQKQSGASPSEDIISAIDDSRTRTVDAIVEAISELSARQEAVALNAPAHERDLMVEKLVNVLSPMVESLQTDPIDYEFLTKELAQAVKPHISQLIDLASDKRETADLIVQRILPLLPALNNLPFDTDAITLKLITEVRRAIAPIDAFEIKEQVADLVVERLDSRLAVRDKAFNVDTVTLKVTESVSQLLETLNSVPAVVEQLASSQKRADERENALVATQKDIMASIADVPYKVGSQLEQLKTGQDVIIEKLSQPPPTPDPDPNVFLIRDVVESLEKGQNKLSQQNEDTLNQSKLLGERLDALPETLTTIATGLRQTLSELITSNDGSKREADELRKLNTECQMQLSRARSLHGQVRVEKDMLSEKLAVVESDRDRLRVQVQELQAAALSKTTETAAFEARNAELEDSLAKALARLQTADAAAQSDRNTIAELEKTKRDAIIEKDSLKTKVGNSFLMPLGYLIWTKIGRCFGSRGCLYAS